MQSSRADAWRRRFAAWTAVAFVLVGHGPTEAQAPAPPTGVTRLDLASLAGDWVEVASSGSRPPGRCVGDTRHQVRTRGDRSLRLTTRCRTREGVLIRHGVVTGSRAGDGRLQLRYVPRVFAWAPGARTDVLVLAAPPGAGWMLAGDGGRRWLVVWSRALALDESAYAAAIAVARSQGFDVSRLVRVPQPSGVTGPTPGA